MQHASSDPAPRRGLARTRVSLTTEGTVGFTGLPSHLTETEGWVAVQGRGGATQTPPQ